MGASIASIHEVRIYRPFIDGLRAIAILTIVGSRTHNDDPSSGNRSFRKRQTHRSNQSHLYGMPSQQGYRAFFFDTSNLSSAGAEHLYQGYKREFLWALTGDGVGNKVSKESSLLFVPEKHCRVGAESFAGVRVQIEHVPAAIELELHAAGRIESREMINHIARHGIGRDHVGIAMRN